ncbi:MAG TPA: 50S ribosomal protein L5 [Candidatus Hydrogenedentes bacterium]|nr:50S ribosomal protein L5 [Candidatus Hydrogenedentota bacterium]HOL77748.1 50S ribosomal protein L5 [Candidatus Hydrogenedentota bacterium]HPO86438.1 50S ribosomal protein L5 [Candidatus Hydrogenedentota bacterium]
MAARLKERYIKEIVPALCRDLNRKNILAVPRLEKIVINMGVGDAIGEPRMLEAAMNELGLITGQKPAIRKARKSIASFKVRQGANIACMVTLRGERMYEFMDRLFNVAIPRIRDFRGISPNSFDGHGNFTLGLKEQTIFPEINIDNVLRVRGMNITFVIRNAHSADESRALLKALGMPFRS